MEVEEANLTIVDQERKKKKRKKIKESLNTEQQQDTPIEEDQNQMEVEEERKKKKRKKIRELLRTEEQQGIPIEGAAEEEQNQTNHEEHQQEKKKKIRVKKIDKVKEIIEANIELVSGDPEKISPLVVYFPSGFDPQKYKQSSEEDDLNAKVYRNKNKPNRIEAVVSPKGYKVDFVGSSHSGEAAASQLCTYALGILDKDTGTLKIVPIAANKVLRLAPRPRALNSIDEELSKELKEEDTTVSRTDKLNKLGVLYGTKNNIKQDMKRAKLHQTEDAKTQKLLDHKIEDVSFNKEALETTGGNPARNIPPHNTVADTPENAYPLDRIILKGEWDSLLDVLEFMQSGSELTAGVYPSFVRNRIHKLLEIEDEEERKKLACVFSYITHLIKFKEQRSADRGSSRDHKIPSILNKKFMSMFAESESRFLPAEKINLLISYVLVLTLVADGYRTDITDIAKDLKMTSVSLREHYLNLGCKLKREDKMLFMALSVPLEFPRARFRRRRK